MGPVALWALWALSLKSTTLIILFDKRKLRVRDRKWLAWGIQPVAARAEN